MLETYKKMEKYKEEAELVVASVIGKLIEIILAPVDFNIQLCYSRWYSYTWQQLSLGFKRE